MDEVAKAKAEAEEVAKAKAEAEEDVAKLVRGERILEAAAISSARGDARTASELYERACDFGSAAREAVRSGDSARAVLLAVTAGDDAMAAQALDRALAHPTSAGVLATKLFARGDFSWAARIFESQNEITKAADSWEKSGEAIRAAEL